MCNVFLPGKLWVQPDPEYSYGLISDYYLVVCNPYGRRKILACVPSAPRKVHHLVFVRGELCPVPPCPCLTSFVSCGKPAAVVRRACTPGNQQRIISVFGLSTYLDTPLVFHAPLWSTLLQLRPRQTVPAQVILCLLLKHTSPGLCCLGDTTSPSPRPVTGLSDRLLSVAKDQVLSTSKVASSCLFVHRHARLSSRAMQIVS